MQVNFGISARVQHSIQEVLLHKMPQRPPSAALRHLCCPQGSPWATLPDKHNALLDVVHLQDTLLQVFRHVCSSFRYLSVIFVLMRQKASTQIQLGKSNPVRLLTNTLLVLLALHSPVRCHRIHLSYLITNILILEGMQTKGKRGDVLEKKFRCPLWLRINAERFTRICCHSDCQAAPFV